MTAANEAQPSDRALVRGRSRGSIRLSIIPLAAILGGLIVGAIVILLSSLIQGDLDLLLPLQAYANLLEGAFGSVRGITFTILAATPLILGGMAVGLGFKAGLFNIGAQGQFLMGALGAAAVGAYVAGAPPIIAIPAAVAAGALLGAGWGFIPGALKAWTGAHEVVTTIMLNFIAGALIGYLITGPLEAPGFSFSRTGPVGNAAYPTFFDTAIHLGVFIAFAARPGRLVAPLAQHARVRDPHGRRQPRRRALRRHAPRLPDDPDDVAVRAAGRPGRRRADPRHQRVHDRLVRDLRSGSTRSRSPSSAARTRSGSCSRRCCSARCAPDRG